MVEITQGQSEGPSHTHLDIDIRHEWDTAMPAGLLSTTPFPKLPTWQVPTHLPGFGLYVTFSSSLLDFSLPSDLALSPNGRICKFHQIENAVLLGHGL